jgi:hypothetical protein
MLSKCFELFRYRRRHRDDHQSHETESMLTVHLLMCMSDGCFAMICDALASGYESHLIASGDFPSSDDHYCALTFLSSFVIVAECLGSRLRIELLSWMLWEYLSKGGQGRGVKITLKISINLATHKLAVSVHLACQQSQRYPVSEVPH